METLQQTAEKVVGEGNNTAGLQDLFTSFQPPNTPWLFLNIDRDKVNAMGVSDGRGVHTLQVYLGSLSYTSIDSTASAGPGRSTIQGDATFRKRIEDLQLLKIRNQRGGMAPFRDHGERRGPEPARILIIALQHVSVGRDQWQPVAGDQLGPGDRTDGNLVQQQIPTSMRMEWTELALLQLQTGNTAMIVFALAVVLVFLVLAAQYESWSAPAGGDPRGPDVPALLGGRRPDGEDGYQHFHPDRVQSSWSAWACKNAILIIEFAKSRREQGVLRYQATLDACMLRLRPILMTSFAFILGVVPLSSPRAPARR